MFIATSVPTATIVLVGAVFLASCVEMVEALTIVLAVGHTRGWRSALEGTGVALVVLSALVAAFGPALVHVPLNILRLIVGAVLLIFGLQWLRKSILRATGLKAKHDEDAIYEATVATLRAAGAAPGRDRIAFVMAFKGVFLEGLEVVILVITLGTSAHRLGLAAFVAALAVVLVTLCGVVVARQLSKVPENLLKMSVGVLLITYGTFWSGEGMRVRWPGGDTWLIVLAALYAFVTWCAVFIVGRSLRSSARVPS